MKLNPYITFAGDCEAAINFYKEVLDGEITVLMRFKEAPPEVFVVADEHKDLIMHCTLEFHGCSLLASDTIELDKHIVGSNHSLSINVKSVEEGATIFNQLLEGGQPIMPFADAFWGGKFGMLVDKFGVQWMISSEH